MNFSTVLAQRGYFKDQAFVNYLKYLQYWKQPEYAKYLMYPMCLYFLDLLQYEHFRREIVNSQCCKFIDDQAILQWQHYTRKRTKMFTAVNGVGQMNLSSSATEGIEQHLQTQSNTATNMQNGITNNSNQQQQLPMQQAQQPVQQFNGVASLGVGGMSQKLQ